MAPTHCEMGVLPLCKLRFLLAGREWLRDTTRQGVLSVAR